MLLMKRFGIKLNKLDRKLKVACVVDIKLFSYGLTLL